MLGVVGDETAVRVCLLASRERVCKINTFIYTYKEF